MAALKLEGAQLKADRGRSHWAHALEAFSGLREESGLTLDHRERRDGGLSYVARLAKPLPADIALDLGDAIHHLRSALDHAVRLLGQKPADEGGEPDYHVADVVLGGRRACRTHWSASERWLVARGQALAVLLVHHGHA